MQAWATQGASNVPASVVCGAGLANTGRVITAAGCIMGVAFLGTLFAHEPVLQHLSWTLVVAVLTDTFVVRAMLVPAMMVTLGKYNWWPRRMPPVTIYAPSEEIVPAMASFDAL